MSVFCVLRGGSSYVISSTSCVYFPTVDSWAWWAGDWFVFYYYIYFALVQIISANISWYAVFLASAIVWVKLFTALDSFYAIARDFIFLGRFYFMDFIILSCWWVFSWVRLCVCVSWDVWGDVRTSSWWYQCRAKISVEMLWLVFVSLYAVRCDLWAGTGRRFD